MHPDVLIAGGGPVGCVAALAFARRGARVALVEPNPEQKDRFAGELLHPTAVAHLARIGIEGLEPVDDHARTQGFAIFGRERSDPFVLNYPRGERGVTFEFPKFLRALREVVAAHPLVDFRPGARVANIEGQRVTLERRDKTTETLDAGLIVGADGRFSHVRSFLGLGHERATLSHMAGLMLHGVDLPFEGYGHVVLSKVGPALIYRVGADAIRVCLDVPPSWKQAEGREKLLWEAYEDALPEPLKKPIEQALRDRKVHWAINAVRPRTSYGRPGLALVGDAVGHFHPMTAIGMTLGFTDATELAAAPDFASYARARDRDSLSPALLATALYEIFAVESEPTRACRSAIFDMWTGSAHLRQRSMDFLSCADTSFGRLLTVGTQLVGRGCLHVAADSAQRRSFGEGVRSVRRIAGLVHWLVHEAVPEPLRFRLVTAAATPFELLRQEQQARLEVTVQEGAA